MFRIKICGITTPGDAVRAVAAGADCLGLNFYPQSKRFLTPERAADVAAAIPAGVVKTGLFVNATVAEACETFDRLSLDLIQLHGDEPPEYLARLGGRPVMRAFRVGSEGFAQVDAYLAECHRLGCLSQQVLIDSYRTGSYGGTGETGDWPAIAAWRRGNPGIPLVLAGGLTAENVAAAIAAVSPAAVDTASGVESAPGVKCPVAMSAFVAAARQAWQSLMPCQPA